MHILVTRPEPDALKLKGLLDERGHDASVEPLLSVSYEDAEPIDLEGVTSLIATSRYGLTALADDADLLQQARRLTVLAVGSATARVARQMGFRQVVTGPGTARDLIPLIVSNFDPTDELMLYLAGDRVATDLAAELGAHGFRVTTSIVYRMLQRARFSDATRDLIADGEIDAVMLMSAETAGVYTRLIQQGNLVPMARGIQHLCISEAVARRLAALTGVPIDVASEPTLEEMLALVDVAEAKLGF